MAPRSTPRKTGSKPNPPKLVRATMRPYAGTSTLGTVEKFSIPIRAIRTLPTPAAASSSCGGLSAKESLEQCLEEIRVARTAISKDWVSTEHEALEWAEHFAAQALEKL